MEVKVIKRKLWNADYLLRFLNSVRNRSSLLKITIRLLFHLIFLKRVNHLFWLNHHFVKKVKMLSIILLRNLRHLPVTSMPSLSLWPRHVRRWASWIPTQEKKLNVFVCLFFFSVNLNALITFAFAFILLLLSTCPFQTVADRAYFKSVPCGIALLCKFVRLFYCIH